jgi:hypothetical protein
MLQPRQWRKGREPGVANGVLAAKVAGAVAGADGEGEPASVVAEEVAPEEVARPRATSICSPTPGGKITMLKPPVRAGISDGILTEVLDGLEEGRRWSSHADDDSTTNCGQPPTVRSGGRRLPGSDPSAKSTGANERRHPHDDLHKVITPAR